MALRENTLHLANHILISVAMDFAWVNVTKIVGYVSKCVKLWNYLPIFDAGGNGFFSQCIVAAKRRLNVLFESVVFVIREISAGSPANKISLYEVVHHARSQLVMMRFILSAANLLDPVGHATCCGRFGSHLGHHWV